MLGNHDPRFQMFAEFFKKQQLASIDAQSNTDNSKNESKQNIRLERKNRLLQERIDILAAALGACSSCFGTVSTCTNCQGLGSVGSQFPVKEAYMLYVLPVVQRFGSMLLSEDKGTDLSDKNV
jgi:hypothetical protein